jgi:hypothetical protein
MKVKELISALKKEDPERVVVLSSDEEGNNHYLLPDNFIGLGYFDLDAKEFYGEEEAEEDYQDDIQEKKFIKALCIYP